MNQESIQEERKRVQKEIKTIMNNLKNICPHITEVGGAASGATAGIGGAGSALYILGTRGFSAPGITSALKTIGSIIPKGGMKTGLGLIVVGVAFFATVGYHIASKRQSAKQTAALTTAITKLYEIQDRLLANAEYFMEELATIKAHINLLKSQEIEINQ